MTDVDTPPKPRSRKLYILWAVALTLLISTGLFCWLVVVPVWQVRGVARRVHEQLDLDNSLVFSGFGLKERVLELGGAKAAAPKLNLYLSLPEVWAPHPEAGTLMLITCREHSSPYLVQILRHERADVRVLAAYALARISAPGRVQSLIVALSDADARVRHQAAQALGRTGDPRAVPPLVAALKDKDFRVRMWAAASLGTIDDKRAIMSLIPLLEDEDEWVRRSAVRALGSLGDQRVVAHLEKSLKDKMADVRQDAAEALKKIKAAQEKPTSPAPPPQP